MDLSNVVAPFVAYQMAMVTMPWITSQFADLYYRLDLSQEANSSHFEDHATQFDFIIGTNEYYSNNSKFLLVISEDI